MNPAPHGKHGFSHNKESPTKRAHVPPGLRNTKAPPRPAEARLSREFVSITFLIKGVSFYLKETPFIWGSEISGLGFLATRV